MKKVVKWMTLLICVCLLFTACVLEAKETDINKNTANFQTMQNLEKLCKVWGYTKYNHPVFLLGEKDWDEELLNLIPLVSKAKEDEVNDILHKWFVSLGEIDYKTLNRVPQWVAAKEEDKIVQADTNWISKDYLGAELTEDLSQLGPIPNVDRSKAPVKFNLWGIADFFNEPTYENVDYSDNNYRLLGLFRVWNAVEYYFPYLDIMDESWHNLLVEYIPKMLEGKNKQSFELTIAELTANLQDAHVGFYDYSFLDETIGKYSVPVYLSQINGKLIVSQVFENCPLQQGDVILKLDDKEIEELISDRKKYISITDEEKIIKKIAPFLLCSQGPSCQLTVLRDNKEIMIEVNTVKRRYESWISEEKSHQLLDGNIGLINPHALKKGEIFSIMEKFKNTDGLIIDLRQYPSQECLEDNSLIGGLSSYLVEQYLPYEIQNLPSQAVPGTYIKMPASRSGYLPENKNYGIYHYSRKVVLLMDEQTCSSTETAVNALRNGENVVVLGEGSVGTNGILTTIFLLDSNALSFSGQEIYSVSGDRTQRIGLAPDIEVHPTIEGIKEGRDELMEAAIEYLKK